MASNSLSSQQVVATAHGKPSPAVTELENTIAGFQAILTDDDRKKLHQLKTEPHDAQSIITFTAELDTVDKNRRGKSVASRLASFLQTIEQFTPIVDTYIQSNPDIAALVWGSIKLTFMFLANFTSYFVSFVELLHGFGSLCTRFAEYQAIFHDSLRLRDQICRFHTSIINCCEKILVAIRRPLKSQVWRAVTQSFQAELRSYVEDIKTKAEIVQRDIELVKVRLDREEQQLQTQERKEASDSRKHIIAWTSMYSADKRAIEARKKKSAAERQRRRLLRELSSYSYTSTFNSQRNRRHFGTAEWVFETSEFQEWSTAKEKHILHLTGKIGSGKTVLSSSIIEKLCQVRLPERFTSFAFLRFDDRQSLDPETVIQSCVQQLLSALPLKDLDPVLLSKIDDALKSTTSELLSDASLVVLYSAVSASVREWFIVLDGLDECALDQQSRLLQFFRKVLGSSSTKYPSIRLLISSRETSSTAIDHVFPECVRLMTGLCHTSADICTYAEDIINAKLAVGELVLGNSEIAKEILETIVSKEQGMFLWAFLSIEDMCSRKSDKEIKKALAEIPADLPATFDRALGRIVQKKNQEIAKKAFSWVEAALQPLTLPQLQEALSIKIGQRTLHQDDLISGIRRLPGWCESLIEVEETDDTVHFSHHSIREFLLTPGTGEFHALHIETDKCSQLVGETCITYISLENFQTALAKTITENASSTTSPAAFNLNMGVIAVQTIQTAANGSIGCYLGRLARSVTKLTKSDRASMVVGLAPSVVDPQLDLGLAVTQYPFSKYANENWFKHMMYLDPEVNKTTWVLLGHILHGNMPYPQSVPWQDHIWRQEIGHELWSWFSDSTIFQFPSLSELFFIFIYAQSRGYWGLCCRVFMLVAELYSKQRRELQQPLQILALTKNHDVCNNRCFSLVSPQLDHSLFVEQVMTTIAQGILYFPALEKEGTRKECGCADKHFQGLQEDICNLLVTGYRREDHPYLAMFATVATQLKNEDLSVTAVSLCEANQIGIDRLFQLRTDSGRSLFDLLIRAVLRRLVDWYYGTQARKDIDLSQFFQGYAAQLDGLYSWEARTKSTVALLESLARSMRSDGGSLEENVDLLLKCGGVVPLHKSTMEKIFVELVIPVSLPQPLAAQIMTLFFGGSVESDLESIHENILREAVRHGNWSFSICLVQLHPPSMDIPPYSGAFEHLKRALHCHACQERNSAPTEVQVLAPHLKHPYFLCLMHFSVFKEMVTWGDLDLEKRSIDGSSFWCS